MLDISQLLTKQCSPCSSKTPKLGNEQVSFYLTFLPGWQLQSGKLEREIKLKNFQESLSLANHIGQIAETENHHPELYVAWGILRISIFTHSIKALSENDFILAAKINKIIEKSKQ